MVDPACDKNHAAQSTICTGDCQAKPAIWPARKSTGRVRCPN